MTLYVQEENYHFDGWVAGVIVDEVKNRITLYNQEGVLEAKEIRIPGENAKWYDLEKIIVKNNRVEITAKNFAIYKKFFCLNIIEL